MIRRVQRTKRDEFTLEETLKKDDHTQAAQPQSYENRVVVKPWGYEFLMFENECVAIWFLQINQGHSTSMHCHPKKTTSLAVLSGQALCSSFEDRFTVNSLEGIFIDKGAYHTTKALSENGIQLIELETPPDKVDLVRLNDTYGRAKKGYESLAEMEVDELERYNYFFFKEPMSQDGDRVDIGHIHMSVSIFADMDEFKNFDPVSDAIYMLCRGALNVSEKNYGLGEMVMGSELMKSDIRIDEKTTLLNIMRKP